MGNPADSKWFATPRAARNRKPLSVTLSAVARRCLEVLAFNDDGSRTSRPLSTVVEEIVLAEARRRHLVVAVEEQLAREGKQDRELDPSTTAALRAFVKERVKTPAKKKGRGPAKP